MGQMRKTTTAASGPRMTEAEITKAVKSYSGGSKSKKQPVDMSKKAIRRREDEDYR